MLIATQPEADLLFALEAALPFVASAAEDKIRGSAGGPVAIRNLLDRYDWDKQRWEFVQEVE